MRARMGTGVLAVAGLCAIACMTRAPTSAPPSSVRARQEPPWAIVYQRECRGSITPPRVAPSNRLFTLCDAAFDLETGTFRANVPIGVLALLDDRRALFDDYSGGGLVLGTIDDLQHQAAVKAQGGAPAMAAPSLDGKRWAVLETKDRSGSSELVVRETGSLRAVTRTPLEHTGGDDVVAFIDAGDPIVLTDRDCRRLACGKDCEKTACASRGVFRATAKGLVSLGERFDRVARLSASPRRALIVRDDGQREIVSLPDGKRLAALPPLPSDADEDTRAIAVDARGERFAYIDGGLRIVKLAAGRVVELHHDPSLEPQSLVFSPDGKWLFADRGVNISVLHEGAEPKPPLAASYPAAPSGFAASRQRGGEQTFTDFEDSSEIVWANQIARFRSKDSMVDVWVFAGDSAELGHAGSIEAWSRAAIARYEGARANPEGVKSWGSGRERFLEYATFVRDGCDPVDRYVRITDKDGVVYRVVVEVPPGSKRAFVAPLLERFFDQAFGAPSVERKLALAPPARSGRC